MSRDNLETTRDESASRLGTGIIYVEGRGKKKGGVKAISDWLDGGGG